MVYKKFLNSICVFALSFLLVAGFVGCSASYSASSIKEKLTNAGYTVTEVESIKFTDDTNTTALKGLQKIYDVSKGEGADIEVAYILVFDSIANADSSNLSDQHLGDLDDTVKQNCGSSKIDNIIIGRFNNVVFAGTKAIQSAAGLG